MVAADVSSVNKDVFQELENFGRYQTLQFILICLPLFVVSMSIVNYVFVAEDVNYRCRVPECDGVNATVEVPLWWPEDPDTRCMRPVLDPSFNLTRGQCSNVTFLPIREECTEWIYESENSVVAGLNLGCQSWIATLVGSAHNSGMIASMILTGWVADKVGRKPTVIICAIGGALGISKIFITNYYIYLVVEFLESFLSSGLYTVGVVLLIEVAGDRKRVLAGVIFSYATYVGEVLFAFFAMGLKHWKYLILVANVPSLFFIVYFFILRESTRWQMLRGKMDAAKETFKKIAKTNNLNISAKEIDDISDEDLREKFNVLVQKEKESLREILRSKEIMVRLLVSSACFFSSSFVYCGLLVHSVFLPGNKYTNFALASLTSFPGDMLAFYTFNKFGRKVTLQYGYFATAVFILAQAYTPHTLPWLKVALFLLGKFAVVVCFTGIFTYSMELFPTSIRGSLVGVGNTAARIGSMLSPLTPLLTSEIETLPSILFASTVILAGLLLIFTPETKNMPLFDTIAQVEAYKAKNKSAA
ncbi:organic cation transporter protein-like [Pectinophora gossypiella]|uniref:organic cation transporter protein-like n=1 Tax=Pectinophora gossypiella TaxID=13191 RepID=UPI00214E2CDD|nr:organic cation transporter protein-like [Pectinophora gossypiella]